MHAFFDGKAEAAKSEDDLVSVEQSRAICLAYVIHYGLDTDMQTVGIEVPFTLPLYTPEGKPVIRSDGSQAHYTGIIDWMFLHKGKLWIADHKTRSKEPGQTYWSNLDTAPQLSQYALACRQAGMELAGCLWDVLVKPTISPKKLYSKDKEELASGSYCGQLFTGAYTGEEDRETPQMFGHRCLWKILEKPNFYFFRREIKRSNSEIYNHLQFLNWCERAANLITSEDKAAQNKYACHDYNTMCDYHSICGYDDRSNFMTRESRGPDSGPSGSWSDTRCSTFMRCRRLWWFKYKEKIEPIAQKFKPSLATGDYVHQGLEILKRVTFDPNRKVSFDC